MSHQIRALALIALSVFIVLISSSFDYNNHWLDRPTYLYVALMICAGGFYLSIVWPKPDNSSIKLSIKWIFYVGLLLRGLFIPSTPIWEDDFYRYFFDGALVNQGINPYQYAPLDAFEKPPIEGAELLGVIQEVTPPAPELLFLHEEALLDRVAYPHIKTIYPPVTQVFFALSSRLNSFDIVTWRLLLIIIEVISFFLLLTLLKQLQKPSSLVAIYWLNPLIITETINAAHMDALIVPFLVATLIIATRKKIALSGISLALAAGIKLWPILLAPLLFRPYLKSLPNLLKKSCPFVLVTVILLSPQFISALDQQAGLTNYAQYWQTNSFTFMWLQSFVTYMSNYEFMPFYEPGLVARGIIAAIILMLLLKLMTKNWESVEELITQWLVIIAALFLLSPTGYPWYILWFMPLLVIKPNKALLLLTLLLPLYDLRYPLEALGNKYIFDYLVITLEFLPCLIMLGITYRTQKNKTHIG